jgi:hypothetical protein
MGEDHPMAAARYAALSPIRAWLGSRAQDWMKGERRA